MSIEFSYKITTDENFEEISKDHFEAIQIIKKLLYISKPKIIKMERIE